MSVILYASKTNSSNSANHFTFSACKEEIHYGIQTPNQVAEHEELTQQIKAITRAATATSRSTRENDDTYDGHLVI